MVAAMKPNSQQNAQEMGTYYEGDLLTPMDSPPCRPAGGSKNGHRWDKAIVPYTFHPHLGKMANTSKK
jgi:hypothetical protein